MTFDTQMTFYHCSQISGEIQLMFVADVEDPFIPLPLSKIMMDLSQDRDKIDAIIDKITNLFTLDD